MKSIITVAIATMATLTLPLGQTQPSAPASKETTYLVTFFETKEGFASRNNRNAETYWTSWMGYIEGVRKAGPVSGGSALLPPAQGSRLTKSGRVFIPEDAPQASGYLIIQAPSLKEAEQRLGKCPALDAGGYVEIRPILDMTSNSGTNLK